MVGWMGCRPHECFSSSNFSCACAFFDEDRHEIGVIPEKREPRKEREGSFRCQTEEGVSTGRMSYAPVGPPSAAPGARRPRFVKMFTLAYETSIDLRSRPK